jgi:hypothetical protein
VRDRISRQLRAELGSVGVILSAFDPECGKSVVLLAPEIADSWADLAEKNRRVRAIIEGGMSASAWGKALVSTGALIAAILAHHKILPPELLQFVRPVDGAAGNGDDDISQALSRIGGGDGHAGASA